MRIIEDGDRWLVEIDFKPGHLDEAIADLKALRRKSTRKLHMLTALKEEAQSNVGSRRTVP